MDPYGCGGSYGYGGSGRYGGSRGYGGGYGYGGAYGSGGAYGYGNPYGHGNPQGQGNPYSQGNPYGHGNTYEDPYDDRPGGCQFCVWYHIDQELPRCGHCGGGRDVRVLDPYREQAGHTGRREQGRPRDPNERERRGAVSGAAGTREYAPQISRGHGGRPNPPGYRPQESGRGVTPNRRPHPHIRFSDTEVSDIESLSDQEIPRRPRPHNRMAETEVSDIESLSDQEIPAYANRPHYGARGGRRM